MSHLVHSLFTGCLGSLLLAITPPAQAQSLQLVGSTASPNDPRGPLDAVAAAGRVYTANFGNSSLAIYNVSQPASPQRVSVLASPGRPRNIALSGNQVYLACYGIGGSLTSDIQAVDVSNATAPVQVKRVTLQGGPLGIDANSSLVCAVSPVGMLYVFDTALIQLSTVALSNPSLVALNGSYAYVLNRLSTGAAQLLTYNLSVPMTPVLTSTVAVAALSTNPSGGKMVFYNGALYVPDSREVFSLANPALPVRQTTLAYELQSASGLLAYGLGRDNTTAKSTVQVYDVRAPFAPVLATSAVSSTTNDINIVTGFGNYVYGLTTSGDYLQVYTYSASPLSSQGTHAPTAVQLYPNPSSTELVTFALPAATQASLPVRVYDGCGRLVYEQVMASGSTQVQLDLKTITPGLYTVRYGVVVQKLVRQ